MAEKAVCCAEFCSLIQARISELKPFSSRRSFRKGDIIYRVDDPADGVFWIESGRAKVVRISPDGQEKIMGLYGMGDVFGELCLCEIARRRDEAVALETLELLSIHASGLMKMMAQTPEFSQALLRIVCQRVLDYQDQVAMLSFDTVSRRLAKELLRLGGAEPGTVLDKDERVATGWTHEELANLIGSTREVVTPLMNQFRDKGMIAYDRHAIVIFPRRIQEFLK